MMQQTQDLPVVVPVPDHLYLAVRDVFYAHKEWQGKSNVPSLVLQNHFIAENSPRVNLIGDWDSRQYPLQNFALILSFGELFHITDIISLHV